jgi:Ca2+-binding EF-hand superfamily protein
VIDTDGNGTISAAELQRLMDRYELTDGPAADQMIAEIDGDGDGLIDFTEFRALMKRLVHAGTRPQAQAA